jgi:hypothetical protein
MLHCNKGFCSTGDTNRFNCLVGCHFADLNKGSIDLARYLSRHEPDVDGKAMGGRGLVLTTTNKDRLDETVGEDSRAFEIVGKPYEGA